MTLSVSSLGKKTQTQRRSCMVLLLWKVSLFIFVLLRQDRPLYRGSGSSDDPPPPPQTPLPPFTVSLLQLQPSTDTPAPSGSAGQAALTRQSMGARAAVSHCGDTSENMKDSMLAQQLISFLCMNYVDVFCSMRNGCVVDLKMMNLFEYLNIKIANLQKNMFPLKESDRRGEIKGRQTKKRRAALLFVSMNMWHHFRGMSMTPEEHVNICLKRNWWNVMTAWKKHQRLSDSYQKNDWFLSHSHLKHNKTSSEL